MSRGKKTKKKMSRRRPEASSIPTVTRRTEMDGPAARGGVAATSKHESFLKLPSLEGSKRHSRPRSASTTVNDLAHVKSSKTLNEPFRENLNALFDIGELRKLKNTLCVTDLSHVPLLLGAVVLEKAETVKKLLKDGHWVNSCAEDKSTPLMWAVRNKNLEMINVLIQHDADPTLLDNNTDNVALIAIQSSSWDENDFLDFWKTISCRIDLDHANLTGNTILHYAIKRQWNVLVEQILKTEANVNCANLKGVTPLMMAGIRVNPFMVSALLRSHADVSQEDFRGCTALCYSIASGMQKKFQAPHPSLEKLVCAVSAEESKLTMESYLKRRLELLIHPPEPENSFTSTVNSIIRSVFAFFIQYTQSGLKIFLRLDIFGKIREAVYQHIESCCYLQAILGILIDLLCYCDDENFAEVSERELIDLFMTAGLPDTCLCVLKRYAKDSTNKWLTTSGLELIFAKCTKNEKARKWLRDNYHHLEPYCSKFINKNSLLDKAVEDRRHNYFETLSDSVSGKTDRPSPKHPSAPSIGSSKSQCRKMETLKIKLAKIRSLAGLAESKDCCDQSEADVNHFTKNNRPPSLHNKQAIDFRVKDRTPRPMSHPELSLRMNSNGSSRLAQVMQINKVDLECSKTAVSDPDVSNIEAILNIGISADGDSTGNNNSEVLVVENQANFAMDNETDVQNDAPCHLCTDDLHESDHSNEYAHDNVEATISYLSTLFEEIISSYRRNWKRDRELGYPGYKGAHGDAEAATEEQMNIRTEELARLNAILPKLEDSCVKKLTDNWRSLISKISQIASQNAKEVKHITTLLQLRLLMYQVCPTDYFDKKNDKKLPIQTASDDANENVESIDDRSVERTGSESIPKSTREINYDEAFKSQGTQLRLFHSINTLVDGTPLMKTETETVNTDNEQRMLQTSMYQCCEQEITKRNMNSANPVNPIDTKAVVYTAQTVEDLRTQVTINTTMHTFGKLLQTSSDTSVYSTIPPVYQLQTTKATPFTLTQNPWLVKNRNIIDGKRHPAPWDGPTTRASVSRWDVLITELRSHFNQRRYLTGEVVLSAAEQRKHFTISPGGTFGPIELGLDANSSPLAVRRLPRECSSTILPFLTPMLTLRHGNILPFFIHAMDGTEIILGTPLCEYNLGEYLMCLKMSEALEQRSLVLITQLLAGLSYLHNRAAPIVHGNIKPSNLMIDRAGSLRLAEFGLWKSLYSNNHPPSSSLIWFARESYEKYKEEEIFECTCSTDIQVAGMIVHFILTGGLHPYGTQASDILERIVRGHPTIQCQGYEVVDLISWMLVFEPLERPSVNQILAHIFFWDMNKKWSFLLTCAGMTVNGTALPLPLEDFLKDLENKALHYGVKCDWLLVLQKEFPDVIKAKEEYSDSPTCLLFFIRKLLQSQPIDHRYFVQQFILEAFPMLPLSLYRLLETTRWLSHPVFSSFIQLE